MPTPSPRLGRSMAVLRGMAVVRARLSRLALPASSDDAAPVAWRPFRIPLRWDRQYWSDRSCSHRWNCPHRRQLPESGEESVSLRLFRRLLHVVSFSGRQYHTEAFLETTVLAEDFTDETDSRHASINGTPSLDSDSDSDDPANLLYTVKFDSDSDDEEDGLSWCLWPFLKRCRGFFARGSGFRRRDIEAVR